MKRKEIYEVELRDQKYSGQRESKMGLARSAGDAEKKALASCKGDVAWSKPYVTKVEFVGYLEF